MRWRVRGGIHVCKTNEEEEERMLPLGLVHEEETRSSTVKKSQCAMSADEHWVSQPQLELKTLMIHEINEPTVGPHASSAFADILFRKGSPDFSPFEETLP